jgi:hypothetical protein
MNTNLKYLLGGSAFLICAGVGFIVTRAIKGSSPKMELQQVEASSVKETNEVIKDTVSPVPENNVQEMPVLQKPVKIVSAVVKKTGDDYTLQITCSDVPANVVLGYEIPDLRMKNTDGYFIRIPGRKSGNYRVNVTNSLTGEVLASKTVTGFIREETKVELMSSGEFQALLLNQNDNSLLGGKHPKVAKSVALSFEGLRDDDRRPGDILAVREKIAYGIWTSAKVIKVGYDESGRINSARIQPIY